MSQLTSFLNPWSKENLADYFSLMFFDYLIVREPEFSKKLLAMNPEAFYAHSRGNDINTHLASNHQLCQHNRKMFFEQLVKSNPHVFARLEPNKSFINHAGIHADLLTMDKSVTKTYLLSFSEINSFIADMSAKKLSVIWWPTHFESSEICTTWMRKRFHDKMDSAGNGNNGDDELPYFLSNI